MGKKTLLQDGKPRVVSTGWRDTVLICKKCSKKLNGGFGEGGEDTFKQAARRTLKEAGQRGTVGLLDAACFGICPKHAVTIAIASRPFELLVMPEGARLDGLLSTLSPVSDEPAERVKTTA